MAEQSERRSWLRTNNVRKEDEEKNQPVDVVEIVVGDIGLGRHL